MQKLVRNKWALILGGSSGLGLATAHKLALHGFNLLVVHRDRKTDMEGIQREFETIRAKGVTLNTINGDAISADRRQAMLSEMKQILKDNTIDVLVHSIAKGNLKPMLSDTSSTLKNQDFQLTIDAMALSFYDWTKLLIENKCLASDARVMAFTSEGNTKSWSSYAAVSAAKAALEAIMRNMALEFAPLGIKCNCIQAGVTETKSLKMIPGHELLIKAAQQRNPNKRLTRPEDVANVVYLLTKEEALWINGTVIKVDGGESIR
ncbi:MAG: SDR family oxidoreductase [Croceitalea sp.]|nr:SDR family oxidoreductase [Croceitalea sp.]